MPAPLQRLPIDEALPQLLAALRTHACVVLRAPTGAGKTTRVPTAVLDAGLAGAGQVVMLEPRRVAARAAARRMAQERGGELGEEIGYAVRLDRKASARTRVLVVTEGLLVRRLQDDPFLEGISVVIFDEFHERNLDTDLALAMVRRIQGEVRPDLKVVVMSATLQPHKLAAWLGNAAVVESEGRSYPVEIEYSPRDDEGPLPPQVAQGVSKALDKTTGDVLAFLPGVGEIQRTKHELEGLAQRKGVLLCELYGDLPPEAQDRALRKQAQRRVILATNVAETSVTVDGVTAVVDSGWARVARFDPGVGLDRLELERISRASADQRAGRAGRTAPGWCLRLWSAGMQRSLQEETEPEIRRVDLAGPVLQLLDFGERDVRAFPWYEAPQETAMSAAYALLEELRVVDAGHLTALGKDLARMAAHPRLARLVWEGVRRGVLAETALAAALLSERDPFPRHALRARLSDSDVYDRVRALQAWDAGHGGGWLGSPNPAGAQAVLRTAELLERDVARLRIAVLNDEDPVDVAFGRALLAAWPDRLAVRREAGSRRGVAVGGRGVTLAEESGVVDAELFLCVDVDAGRRGERAEAVVRQASRVEREWLDPDLIRVTHTGGWDEAGGRVVALRRTSFLDLVLEEVQTGVPDAEACAQALAAAARRDPARVLPLADEDVVQLRARVACLREWLPELELPLLDEAKILADIESFVWGARSIDEVKKRDLAAHLKAQLSTEHQRALDRDAPERIEIPTGSRIRLVYEPGRTPILAARIQELFGMKETPRLARGRAKVVMHLLAPNYRPQQVTDDLASFWSNAYHEVKKDLKRRYPKHAWPDDPLTAPPQRKGPSQRS